MDVSEMEKHVLYNVFNRAKKLVDWTTDDWDDEAKVDFDKLREAVKQAGQFLELKDEAERAARAANYRNVAAGL